MGDPVRTMQVAESDYTVLQITFPVSAAPRDWDTAERIEWSGIVTEVLDPATGEIEPVIPVFGLHLAISGSAAPVVRVASVQWYRQPNQPADVIAEAGVPSIFRGVPLAPVQVFVEAGGGVLAGLVLEVHHPAPADLGKSLTDPLSQRRAAAERAPDAVANPDHFRALRIRSMSRTPTTKATRTFDPFALTGNWIRLEVKQTGIYALTGQRLEQLGLNLAQVNPVTLRLFKGGGLALDPDPELPDAEQADRVGLTEVAIEVRDGDDGEFNADDSLLFYGLDTDVWLDRLVSEDPGPVPEEHDERMAYYLRHYNHPFQDHGVYWLTWEGPSQTSPFESPPLRVGPPQVSMPTGSETITTHRARYHGEQNLVYLGGFVRDNWVWNSRINHTFLMTAALRGVVSDAPAYWQVDFCANSFVNRSASLTTTVTINQDDPVTRVWRMIADQHNAEQVRIKGATTSLQSGSNAVRFENGSFAQTSVFQAVDSFDLMYHATLDKNDFPASALTNVFWGDEVSAPGTIQDVRYTLPTTGQMRLWDVTEPRGVFALEGEVSNGPPRTLTIGLQRDPGQTRHLVLFGEDDLLSADAARRVQVRPLRQELAQRPVDYVVIHPAAFTQAAERLMELRSRTLPGVEAPDAAAVSVEDIYANFSGGQKDWRAIRQFLRWHFYGLPEGQRLQWVCLLGNASRYHRNYGNAVPGDGLYDWVPTDIITNFPNLFSYQSLDNPFASDASHVALDSPAGSGIAFDMPDLAVGRLPANSPAEALAMVDRMRAYVEEPARGPWRNHVTFCADDLHHSRYSFTNERRHMDQAERLANLFLPPSLEIAKVYLDAYPFEGPNYKPSARRDLLSTLNAGTSIFYYVGHGNFDQLADEQVFRSDMIPGLTNDGRNFLFLAFSCDVGEFDHPDSRSMAEQFLLPSRGGAIASIAASWVSQITQNDVFSSEFFKALYRPADSQDPESPPTIDPAMTVGVALQNAMAGIWHGVMMIRNALRYNVFGDPALRLVNPVDDLVFAADSADHLMTGRLHHVKLDHSAGSALPAPGSQYQLLVQESAFDVPYSERFWDEPTWRRPGSTVFNGTGNLPAEGDAVSFLAPLSMRTGERGRIRLLVDEDGQERVAFLQAPVEHASVDGGQDVHGPDIRLTFLGGRLRVQVGAELTATLYDTSGINILATNPVNSVLMEFNDSGLYSNVSSDVIFDPGSYTRASLTTNLPQDLERGQHQVVMTASDMFGNVGSDTLRFYLEASGVAAIRDAVVFPNPTSGFCRLACDLSIPMDLRWDIYTVAGRRIRSIRESPVTAGPVILEWDGRDGEGDTIANGVYLYVLRGTIPGSGHELRETGQIVIMR